MREDLLLPFARYRLRDMRAGLARGWAGEGRFLPAKKCTGEMVCAGVRGDLHSDVQVGMAPPRPTDLLRVLAWHTLRWRVVSYS